MSHYEVKDSLEEELSCPVCQRLLSEPVTLPCGHTFCEVCLEGVVTSRSREGGWHYCSECKKGFQGLGTLPKNLMLCRIIESYKNGLGEAASNSIPMTQQQKGSKKLDIQTGDSYTSHPDLASDEGQKNIALLEVSPSAPLEDIEVGAGLDPRSACPSDEPALKLETNEGRIRLSGLAENLRIKLATTEVLLFKETEKQAEARAVHDGLREKIAGLLQQMSDMVEKYTMIGTELIEAQFQPIEEAMDRHVKHVSDFLSQLKDVQLQVSGLLEEQDGAKFCQGLSTVEPMITRLVGVPLQEMIKDPEVTSPNLAGACSELELQSAQLRVELGSAQRALRNLLNPSEVTFDPDTVHPSLVLSEDLKTVMFSPIKQPYPSHTKRFTNFLQALSSQSFGESLGVAGGEHCWELELENCSWIVGMCCGGLPRSGVGSALESCSGCWSLMYCDNLLRAYENTKATQLKRTTSLRRVQIHVSFNNQSVSFYSVSNLDTTKTLLHTFEVAFTEPVYLAIRMMSGQPKARITVC
ncbi:E3 ubiquitin-protein ligase TRIM39 [Alosa sapidissima]|uniref:E3 ubiquitin-protein ligase TRIM39 n=1 Tax=Alosa sapidissima TaxID=34773 RepID=UPI001C083A5E|nr:E3 ubiquitin-protein ligase TRIM39 [Alosa sapidissima]XP_041945691.1 E3 ubiquitin-protein ligase TRIM39 [Alosa sapidissima]